MTPTAPHQYRVDAGIEVDRSKAVVVIGGTEHHVRPKSLAVLLDLIENRERVVSKEELLHRIWDGAAVTDDALTQCISDLRRLLGDDPKQPKFIRTIPKQGFRFIAPVEEIFPPEPATPAPVTDAVPTVAGDDSAGKSGRRSWITVGVLSVALVTVIGTLVWIWRIRDQGNLSDGRIVAAISSFENRTGRPDLDWMREGLPDMLAGSLARSPKLSLLPRSEGGSRTSRAKVLISGAYTAIGEALRVEVLITRAQDKRILGSEILTVEKPEELLTRFDGLAVRTAAALQAPLPSNAAGAAAEARTANLEAYRLYTLGVEKADNFHYLEAIALFERALEIDPDFHMANARIGYAHAFSRGLGHEGLPYLQKALSRSARMNGRDRLFVEAWHSFASGDIPRTIQTYRRIIREYPDELSAYVALARLYRGEKQFQEARQVLTQAVSIDPGWADAHNLLSGVLFSLGQREQALKSALRYAELKPDEANAHDSVGMVFHRMGRYEDAIQSYRHALALKPDFEIAMVHLGNTLVHLGRYRDALIEFRRCQSVARAKEQRQRAAESIAWTLWKRGDAKAAMQQDLKPGPLRNAIALDAAAAAPNGGVPVNLAVEPTPFNARGARLSRRFDTALLGLAALRSNHAEQGLSLMKEALQQLPEYYMQTDSEECLADAYLWLGRLDEAVIEYRRVAAMHPNMATARYGLGVALARKGELNGARVELTKFLELWKNADRDLPQYREAVRWLNVIDKSQH
jgi:tetratricopeptide (TPR) repeat protein/DNA-binding winged helix-turn-helix (wHTH) protein